MAVAGFLVLYRLAGFLWQGAEIELPVYDKSAHRQPHGAGS